jgi:hypothetical protein
MPFIVACPKCGQKLKIDDGTMGKNVKCPGCSLVFLTRGSNPSPAEPNPVTLPPAVMKAPPNKPPTLPSAARMEPDGPTMKPLRRSPPPVKKKSNALLYGCLGAALAGILFVGLIIGGIFWLVHKAHNAVREQLIALKEEAESHPLDLADDPDPGAGDALPPALDAAFQAEIDHAGAGVKLTKMDLAPFGLDLTIEAPEGAKAKNESPEEIEISKDRHFGLTISIGKV